MPFGFSEEPIDRLRHSLAAPPVAADIHTVAQLFRIETATITVRRPPQFEDYPDLALRVRGALGNVLYQLGPPKNHWLKREPFARAWDVLQTDVLPGLPKPLVVHVDVLGNSIHIHAHLIGHSAFWQPDVESALVAACDQGVTLSNESRVKAVLEVTSVNRKTLAGFPPPAVQISQCRLSLLTPLRLRSGLWSKISLPSLVISMANRVSGLAKWHGFALDTDWNKLHAEAWALRIVSDTLTPYYWERGSQRVNRRIPMLGFIGELAMTGDLESFVPVFQICEYMNAGSHASLGLGRYRLMLLP